MHRRPHCTKVCLLENTIVFQDREYSVLTQKSYGENEFV